MAGNTEDLSTRTTLPGSSVSQESKNTQDFFSGKIEEVKARKAQEAMVNQYLIQGCNKTANLLIAEINALREITY